MALNFPPSPALDDLYVAEGRTWRWNGNGWAIAPSIQTTEAINAGLGYEAQRPIAFEDGAPSRPLPQGSLHLDRTTRRLYLRAGNLWLFTQFDLDWQQTATWGTADATWQLQPPELEPIGQSWNEISDWSESVTWKGISLPQEPPDPEPVELSWTGTLSWSNSLTWA